MEIFFLLPTVEFAVVPIDSNMPQCGIAAGQTECLSLRSASGSGIIAVNTAVTIATIWVERHSS